ncbi:protein kinase [Streptomyces sp. NPDC058409]|uniref:protein kinase domain-containing protein n=1 Tax=Streptomyces sp. NPDC058409 TaxID=3346484 RepID=UPI0036633E18
MLIVDDLEHGHRRAIKTPLYAELTGDAELAMLLELEPHPHTVTTLDVIEIRGRSGIVFEYAPSTLTDLLRQHHRVASLQPSPDGRRDEPATTNVPPLPNRLAEILQQVCDGMAHLSRITEVAHLDLKPPNVLVDKTGHAKVADFGLAQHVRIRHGRFSTARGGTWAYAAPEVLRQEPCDTRADVFSFGVLLYEACTGRLPYPFALAPDPDTQRAQLLDYYASSGPRHRAEELYYWGQSTMTQVPVLPPGEGISIVLSSCLQQYTEKRPQSFGMLADMLARSLSRPPIEAAGIPLPEIDRQHRELALAQVLIRLGRLDEAVNRLNRLLTTPLPPELSATVVETARKALTGAGRHAEAAALMDWR